LLRQEEQDDKERVEAIYVAVFTVFIDSIMFSIVLPSMAIYLQTFTPSSSPDYALYLGILVAAHPFGQLIGSPLAGLHFTKRGARESMLIFLFIFNAGCVFYAYADTGFLLMIGRLIQGFGDANLAVCRAFVGKSSKPNEKMKYMSYISAAQALGFTCGSLIGGSLSLVDFDFLGRNVNQFTAPAYVSFLLGLANICGVFTNFKYDSMKIGGPTSPVDAPVPNRTAVVACMLMFFMLISSFSILLTVTTAYLNLNYGWEVGEISIIYILGSIIGFLAFVTIHKLDQFFSERHMLIFGFFAIALATLTEGGYGYFASPLWMWITGVMIFFLGHPFAMASTLSLYSKIIGPHAQGIYMGFVTAVGSFASIVSPLWGTAIMDLENFRGRITFMSTGLLLLVGLLTSLFTYPYLIPHPLETRPLWGESKPKPYEALSDEDSDVVELEKGAAVSARR